MTAPPNRNRRLLAGLLLSLAGMGVVGFVVWLVGLQFSTGSAYPAYSTFRTDPLGAKALYESFQALPSFEVSRNLTAWHRTKFAGPTTIFLLGASPDDLTNALDTETKPAEKKDEGEPEDDPPLDKKELERLRERTPSALIGQWLDQGHRVVVALSPAAPFLAPTAQSNAERRQHKKTPPPEETPPEREDPAPPDKAEKPEAPEIGKSDTPRPAATFLGLSFQKADRLAGGGQPDGTLPDLPPWHGSHVLAFADDSGWKSLATFGNRVVMAERPAGAGSIMVITDSYFASNEGLWKEPHAEFLLHLAGGHHRLVFDETHLGTEEDPGVMTLMRRLRLHGLVIGGLLLFGLLLWQGLVPLVPVDPNRDLGAGPGQAVVRDSVDGLIALLRRGLPPSKVLQHCLDRWAQHPEGRATVPAPSVESARHLAENARPGSLASAYLAIRHLLDPRRSPSKPDHGNTRSP